MERYDAYVVRQGDYLEKLAHTFGFSLEEVWSHPKNAEIRAKRSDHNLLCPGDILYLPVKEQRSLPLRRGVTNRYIAKVPKVEIRLILQSEGEPIREEPYVVEGLRKPLEGKTSDIGEVTFSVPINTREVRLLLPEKNVSYPIFVGDLDPIDEPSGVRMRLMHLGYYGWHPQSDGADEQLDREAIRAFQRSNAIEATGVMDEATRVALREAHGS